MKPRSVQQLRRRLDELAAPLLTFLAAEPDRFERFLALTGLDVAGLRAASRQDRFAESLWSYLASDEALLLGFAREASLDPADVAMLAAAAQPPDGEHP